MVEETGERLMRVREMAAEHRIRAERLSRMIDANSSAISG